MAPRRRPRGVRSGRSPGRRHWLAAPLLGVALTLATSFVKQQAIARYADVEGCANGCSVAAAGWPLPWLVDDPSVSPVNSVSLSGALFGLDHWRFEGLAVDLVLWTLAAALALLVLRRRR
ncbi:hypothetical protein [Lysobacter xanthus]